MTNGCKNSANAAENSNLIIRGRVSHLTYNPALETESKARYFLILAYWRSYKPYLEHFSVGIYSLMAAVAFSLCCDPIFEQAKDKRKTVKKDSDGVERNPSCFERGKRINRGLSQDRLFYMFYAQFVYATAYYVFDFIVDVFTYRQIEDVLIKRFALFAIAA